MPSRFFIYALVDPRTSQWRYVGKSTSGMRRPRNHTQPSHLKARTHKNCWVKSLLRLGLAPGIEVVEEFASKEGLSAAECEWIAEARRQGVDLTNSTDGGEGRNGATVSQETRTKMSIAHKNKPPISEETRARMSRAKTERVIPIGERLALSLSHGGRPFRDRDGNRYVSYTDAAAKLGISWGTVRDYLKGRSKKNPFGLTYEDSRVGRR